MAQLVKNLPTVQETWVGKIPWRRERLPTPVFWPGEFHGLYSPRGLKESDTTEQLSLSLYLTQSKQQQQQKEVENMGRRNFDGIKSLQILKATSLE